MVNAFEKASGKKIPYKIYPRRAGDIAICYADPSLANKELSWKTKFSIQDACNDSWRWQFNNPNGYKI
jgi:UDP-glucose 4-epimerase